MGLLINIPKKSNRMYLDFPNAYWYLDNIRVIYDTDNNQRVLYDVKAYPSRDIKNIDGRYTAPAYSFGYPTASTVDSCLYTFTDNHVTVDIFPEGLPADKSTIKKALYIHFKQYLDSLEIAYVDVLEEETDAEQV